jgi:hypothetical protein
MQPPVPPLHIQVLCLHQRNGSAIGTAYRLDDRGIDVRVLVGSIIFTSPYPPYWFWGLQTSPYPMGTGGSFLRG